MIPYLLNLCPSTKVGFLWRKYYFIILVLWDFKAYSDIAKMDPVFHDYLLSVKLKIFVGNIVIWNTEIWNTEMAKKIDPIPSLSLVEPNTFCNLLAR